MVLQSRTARDFCCFALAVLFLHAPAFADRTVPGVRAWGDNFYGQLGLGDSEDRDQPVRLTAISGVTQVAAGRFHALALRSDGTVWAWGGNNFGQLGDGTLVDRSTPAPVAGLRNVIAVSAGLDHNLALLADGSVWAWGQNYNGQVGDGTSANVRTLPVRVSGLRDVIAIAAGGYHSLALRSDGTVWGWGWNVEGQVGSGSLAQQDVPTRVVGPGGAGFLGGAVAIAGGHYHSLALRSDGTVWAWGWNSDGQLGNGQTEDALTPALIDRLQDAFQIAAGQQHSLALTAPPVVLSGQIVLQGLTGESDLQAVTVEFQPVHASGAFTRTLEIDAQGLFQIDDVPGRAYSVRISAGRWLARRIPVDATNGDVANVQITLLAGDANNDNVVDVLDLALVIGAFDALEGDAHWNPGADLNVDGSVDILDLDLLIRNFDLTGDA